MMLKCLSRGFLFVFWSGFVSESCSLYIDIKGRFVRSDV